VAIEAVIRHQVLHFPGHGKRSRNESSPAN
jgi:hypothetical protein